MMDSDQISAGLDGGVQVSRAFVPEPYIRLSALTVLFCVSLLCGFSPLWVMRRALRFTSDPGSRRQRVLSLMSSFACGVFLASALLERLPGYLDDMTQTFSRFGVTLHFPLPEFILAMGFLVAFVVEQILLAFRDQPCDLSYEKEALLDSGLQRWEPDAPKHLYQPPGKVSCRRRPSGMDGFRFPEDARSHTGLRIFLLLFSLCSHAVFKGLTVAEQLGREPHLEILLALALHEGIVAVSLGFQLTRYDLRRTVVTACLFLFSVMCPAGIGLTVVLTEMKPSPKLQLVRYAVEGLTLGIFINITVMGLVWQDLGSPKHRIHKVAFLLTGFAVITGVLFLKT